MDEEEKRSEPRALGHSDDQRVSDQEESAEMEKAWPVMAEDITLVLCKARGMFEGERSDCPYQILLLD